MKKRKTKRFVTNAGAEAPADQSTFESLTVNIAAVNVRNETLEGVEYLVAPMIMMTEGVHAGSNGPLYYPAEELAEVPIVWNNKPIVVYHPSKDGKGVSACTPEIMENYKIGVIMNTEFDGKRLKAEAWLNPERVQAVDPRITDAINNKQMMELSTGLFADHEEVEGNFEGESYVAIARNYRPDHLALLPDKIGACSCSDGAGFLRNEIHNRLNDKGKLDKSSVTKVVNAMYDYMEQSFSDIRFQLMTLVRERFGSSSEEDSFHFFVEDVYSNYFVFEGKGDKLFRLSYRVENDKVVLGEEEPIEVVRVTEYRTVGVPPVSNQFTNNQKQQPNANMNKEEIVESLVTNYGWKEDQREFLMGHEEKSLQAIHANAKQLAEELRKGDSSDPKAEPGAKAPTGNAKGNPDDGSSETVEEFIGKAPKGVQEVLRNSVQSYESQKTSTIASILELENNAFKKEQLMEKPLDELTAIYNMAKPPAKPDDEKNSPYYGGQVGVVPVGNQDYEEEPLERPELTFGE